MAQINFDVDIDVANRERALEWFNTTPAMIMRDGQHVKHNTGVYFQPIPQDPLTGISLIDHHEAEEQGWFKVDFLNNHIYAEVRSPEHLDRLCEQEVQWELLEHPEIVEQLYHIGNYADLVREYKPDSVTKLAMLLAIIRPGKKHLQGKTWQEIEQEVWLPSAEAQYTFKKSHSVAFAKAITVQLNLIVEQAYSVRLPD